jgi:hypothetical protein
MRLSDAFRAFAQEGRSPFLDYSKFLPTVDVARYAPAIDYSKFLPTVDVARYAPVIDYSKFLAAVDYGRVAAVVDLPKLAPTLNLGRLNTDFRFPGLRTALADDLLGRVQKLVNDELGEDFEDASIIDVWNATLVDLRQWLARPVQRATTLSLALMIAAIWWFNLKVYHPEVADLVEAPLWAAISLLAGMVAVKQGR